MDNIKRGQHKASFLNGILKENPQARVEDLIKAALKKL